ncbi:C40 family peptidase [Henriciella litoralis]|uniref:C40 family peptidase n=1 Tax=Henriciella litoralis TaxID=568102 RepID=UPI0009FF31D0|nr:NlpC/P60 family protein [Henriciella litoralis]
MPSFDDRRLSIPDANPIGQFQVSAAVVPMRDAPRADAQQVTQALHGETVTLLREEGEFGLIQMHRDRYVGWAPLEGLSAPIIKPTHKVSALRTYAFSAADLKSVPNMLISLGARIHITAEAGEFLKAERAGWLPKQHVAPINDFEDDPAGVALRYLGAPYFWGGCESLGLDCTGLTRAAYDACGVSLPRDSDMQFAWSGKSVDNWREAGTLQRNDLVFWKGHVSIMLDAERMLHANGYHMAVAEEPLSEAIERIAKTNGEPVGVRRIDLVEERHRKPDWLTA